MELRQLGIPADERADHAADGELVAGGGHAVFHAR
jgi:hypothetical protein